MIEKIRFIGLGLFLAMAGCAQMGTLPRRSRHQAAARGVGTGSRVPEHRGPLLSMR